MAQFQNSTVREMASNSLAELAHEQAYLTILYERLDVLKAVTQQRLAEVRLGPTAENDQGWSERESFAQLYQDRTAELEAAERNLCFGRLDFDDDDRFYIGRLGLRSDDHDQLLVDWRARAAEPFYRATPRERYGVTRRRHLRTVGRRVVSLDDDVLDLDAVDETRLTGEAALLASLRRGRTGRMSDIVATIQADQDRIIREDPARNPRRRGRAGYRKNRCRASPRRLSPLYAPQAIGTARNSRHRPERHIPALYRPGAAVARRE